MSEFPKVTKVKIEPVQPESADERVLSHVASKSAAPPKHCVWVVRVALEQIPEPTGLGMELLVGDTPVRKYTQVEDGVCFTVRDTNEMRVLNGKELGWRIPGDDAIQRTGVYINADEPDLCDRSKLRPKSEAYRGKI